MLSRNSLLELFPIGPDIPDHRRFDPLTAVSGAVGIGGNLLGGLLGSHAAKRAAQVQQQNAERVAQMAGDATAGAQKGMGEAVGIANDYLEGATEQQDQVYNPYLAAGTQGVTTLAQMMAPGGDLTKQFSFDPSQVANTPEYQFALDQGVKAVNSSQAAKGLLNSGATLKGLMNYGQGLASQQYQQAYTNAANTFQMNRNNTLQGLMSLTGIGQTAAQQYAGNKLSLANLMSQNTIGGAQYGGNVGLQGAQIAGSALTGGANAQAAGIVGGANAWQNAIAGIGNTLTGVSLANMMKPPQSTPLNYANVQSLPSTSYAANPMYSPTPFPTFAAYPANIRGMMAA